MREDVPPFVRRVGDSVLQGSNNTIIVLGTDRARRGPATVGDGLGHASAPGGGKSAGAIHIIAGRSDPAGNPDMSSDRSFFYLSMRCRIDDALDLASVGASGDPSSAAALKADAVRVVCRRDVKISVDGGSSYIVLTRDGILLEGARIELGKGAGKHLVRYEDLQVLFDGHKHPTAFGPSGVPIPPNAKTMEPQLATRAPNEILVT